VAAASGHDRFGELTSLKEVDIRYCPAGKNMTAALKGQLTNVKAG
jgi:hypothetical protein